MGTSSSTQNQGHGGDTGSNSTSSFSSGLQSLSLGLSTISKREKHFQKKLDSAWKTGVLNLSDMKLNSKTAIWLELGTPSLVTKLKTLDLSGNDLKSLPVEVYGLINLKSLFLTSCSMQYANNMNNLVKLTKLKLDHNDLEVDKIGTMPESLNTLDLSFNHLNGLPAILNGLANLVFLDLSSNRIESLYGIDNLPGLVNLILDDNLLVELPDSICLLVKLKKLSLVRNRFTKNATTRSGQSIPSGLLENTELDNIDLTGNVSLSKADVMGFIGIDKFLQRRQALKDKNFQGGALSDTALFGLD